MVPGEGSRPYHHGNLRASLLTEARDLLEREGAEAVAFRAVARAAGVSQTAPYNHFAGRRDLLAALAAEGFSALAERQQRAAAEAPPGTARFTALGRAYLEFAVAQPQLYRLMFGDGVASWHDVPVVAAAKSASFRPVRDAIAGRADDDAAAEVTAVTAWATVHGLATLLIDGSLDRDRHGRSGLDFALVAVEWFAERALSQVRNPQP